MGEQFPPADDLDEWDARETLEQLHGQRGWPATEIAAYFDVPVGAVRERLRELDLYDPSCHPPKSGFAREIWEAGHPSVGGSP